MRLYAKSHDLKLGDALIAATATKNQAQLWTRNRKHFPMPEVSFH
jgi:predicted nucleic acid-binding protein